MPRLGVAPNEVTYTALIHGYFVHGNRETGFALFEEMMRSGVEPNLYTYNCLIGEWCRTGELERARLLFDEMPAKGIVRNVVSSSRGYAGTVVR
jgi:pentatricopeptide repeat protein